MSSKYYDLKLEDFKRVFKFGAGYYIDPTKNTSGRTTGEPRGLGAILDAFTLGKLTEIGVEKILKDTNNSKEYILDFDIKKNIEVMDEPDIIAISENTKLREPKLFLEIKNTSEKDRWIGLTEEQFNTIKRGAKNKKIYMVYASVQSRTINNNPKTADLTGMFLKEIENLDKSKIFQEFADLNAKCKIEFILSAEDIITFSFPFERGMNIYETNLFEEKNINTVYNGARGTRVDILDSKEFKDFNSTMELEISKNIKAENEKISVFNIKGSFKLFYKRSTTIIECLTDVTLRNEIFGIFNLEKDKFYQFNLSTMGRDPILKRNNLFIAKRNVYQLIDAGKILNPEIVIKTIADTI